MKKKLDSLGVIFHYFDLWERNKHKYVDIVFS